MKEFTMIITDLETISGIKQHCNYSIFKIKHPGFEVNSSEFIHFFCYYLPAPNKPQHPFFVSVTFFVGHENGGGKGDNYINLFATITTQNIRTITFRGLLPYIFRP